MGETATSDSAHSENTSFVDAHLPAGTDTADAAAPTSPPPRSGKPIDRDVPHMAPRNGAVDTAVAGNDLSADAAPVVGDDDEQPAAYMPPCVPGSPPPMTTKTDSNTEAARSLEDHRLIDSVVRGVALSVDDAAPHSSHQDTQPDSTAAGQAAAVSGPIASLAASAASNDRSTHPTGLPAAAAVAAAAVAAAAAAMPPPVGQADPSCIATTAASLVTVTLIAAGPVSPAAADCPPPHVHGIAFRGVPAYVAAPPPSHQPAGVSGDRSASLLCTGKNAVEFVRRFLLMAKGVRLPDRITVDAEAIWGLEQLPVVQGAASCVARGGAGGRGHHEEARHVNPMKRGGGGGGHGGRPPVAQTRRHVNGCTGVTPKPGDVLVWSRTLSRPFGHAAVVVDVEPLPETSPTTLALQPSFGTPPVATGPVTARAVRVRIAEQGHVVVVEEAQGSTQQRPQWPVTQSTMIVVAPNHVASGATTTVRHLGTYSRVLTLLYDDDAEKFSLLDPVEEEERRGDEEEEARRATFVDASGSCIPVTASLFGSRRATSGAVSSLLGWVEIEAPFLNLAMTNFPDLFREPVGCGRVVRQPLPRDVSCPWLVPAEPCDFFLRRSLFGDSAASRGVAMHAEEVADGFYEVDYDFWIRCRNAATSLHRLFVSEGKRLIRELPAAQLSLDFEIPEELVPHLRRTVLTQPCYAGRFDLAFDATLGQLKAMEYNADSSAALLECCDTQEKMARHYRLVERPSVLSPSDPNVSVGADAVENVVSAAAAGGLAASVSTGVYLSPLIAEYWRDLFRRVAPYYQRMEPPVGPPPAAASSAPQTTPQRARRGTTTTAPTPKGRSDAVDGSSMAALPPPPTSAAAAQPVVHFMVDSDDEERYTALWVMKWATQAGFRCKLCVNLVDFNFAPTNAATAATGTVRFPPGALSSLLLHPHAAWSASQRATDATNYFVSPVVPVPAFTGVQLEAAEGIVDLEGVPVTMVWKTWSWDTVLRDYEAQQRRIAGDGVRPTRPTLSHILLHPNVFVFEPLWKEIIGSKAMLPNVFKASPAHENILAAAFDLTVQANDSPEERRVKEQLSHSYVRKPVSGRAGMNISVHTDALAAAQRTASSQNSPLSNVTSDPAISPLSECGCEGPTAAADGSGVSVVDVTTTGQFGSHRAFIYQQRIRLSMYPGDMYPIFGAWVIGDDNLRATANAAAELVAHFAPGGSAATTPTQIPNGVPHQQRSRTHSVTGGGTDDSAAPAACTAAMGATFGGLVCREDKSLVTSLGSAVAPVRLVRW